MNAGKEVVDVPSLTLSTMFGYEPASVGAGIPDSRPVPESSTAQGGLFLIEKVSVAPDNDAAVG